MHRYRAYTIGNDGHIEAEVDLHCENEEAAKARARQLNDGRPIELWQGGQLIAVFESPSSREEEARRAAKEYAGDQRAIIEKLHRKH